MGAMGWHGPEPLMLLNVLGGQFSQIRSVEGDGGTRSWKPGEHTVLLMHTVVDPGSALKVPIGHVTHTRFDVTVTFIVWYCPEGQMLAVLQSTWPGRF
jgi:hypothetical protein